MEVRNSRILRTIPLMLIVMLLCPFAYGKVIYVDDSQANFDNIQSGIDNAESGDTVLVAPGEYVITAPITFRGKAITVESEAGSDETTIRMGTPADTNRGSVVIFENGETAASILDGFTITGGRGSWLQDSLRGGGVFFNAASATVKNCTIVQNTARRAGGVLCDQSSSPTLMDCIIVENASIRSGGGLSVYSGSSLILTNCIIRDNSSAQSAGGGLCCHGDSSATLTDCTITGNSAINAGGIYCGNNSSTTVTYCIIRGNSATGSTLYVSGYGGGVESWDNSLVSLIDCTIAENSAGVAGGAMFCENSSLSMTNCKIVNNTAQLAGGGVECVYAGSSMTISNCTMWGNSAGQQGGGVVCNQGSATVTNSIIWANTAPKGREISLVAGSTLGITYSNLAGGQAGVHVQGASTLDWGEGNIDTDPLFARLGYLDKKGTRDSSDDVWVESDFHLKSQSGRWDPNSQTWVQDEVTSPCIDAGDPNSDWTAELWPHGERINMGAYGGTSQASRSLSDAGIVADLNRDGIVDSADMRIMVDHWGTGEPLCDIGPMPWGDGIVDVQDLIVLAEHLFEEREEGI